MATQSPPAFLQNASHSAALFRQALTAAFAGKPGVGGSAELVTAAQSTPNMSVKVSPGRAMCLGSQVSPPAGQSWTTQGMYFGLNDASVTVTISASNPTNPRFDCIYIAVNDSFYSGSLDTTVIGVVTGTPAVSPVAPATPANSLLLAYIYVAANATTIVSGNISDARTYTAPNTARGVAGAVTVAAEKLPAIISGSGSQVSWAITGWASAPVVQVTLLSAFDWFYRLGAVSSTQINVYVRSGVTTNLPDGTIVDLHVTATGIPTAGVTPTI